MAGRVGSDENDNIYIVTQLESSPGLNLHRARVSGRSIPPGRAEYVRGRPQGVQRDVRIRDILYNGISPRVELKVYQKLYGEVSPRFFLFPLVAFLHIFSRGIFRGHEIPPILNTASALPEGE